MKSEIFIFHGTEGYPEKNWYPWLKKELEAEGYNVFVPQFPTPPVVAAKISEWFDVLKDYESHINEDTVLIGHSLGGIFTLRVLEKLKTPVRAAFLIGTPIGERPIANYERDGSFSGYSFDWERIKKNARDFRVFQSDNDPSVGLINGEKLAEHLGIKLNFVPNAAHFSERTGWRQFPQLLDEVNRVLAKKV